MQVLGRLRGAVGAVRRRTVVVRHWASSHVHALCHLGYFTGVAIEGHGLYALLAGNLAILTVFVLFAAGEEA